MRAAGPIAAAAAIAAALALGGCSGGDHGSSTSSSRRAAQARRDAARPVPGRRRLDRPGPDVLLGRLHHHQRHPARADELPAGRAEPRGSGPRLEAPGRLARRPHRHREDPPRRALLAAREPRGDLAHVKYAIERGFFKTVANAYVGSYFGGLDGARQGVAPGTRIRGIETPDASHIVFRLTRPTGGALAGALALPLSAPVPPEYAARFDAHNPSDYGTHQVATGPYMIERYKAGRRIHLVRNPSWDRATDFRPAVPGRGRHPRGQRRGDRGHAAASCAGAGLVNGDFNPPPAELKRALKDAARAGRAAAHELRPLRDR